MMGNKTIIQPIGPLYGEAVNGTVYGRPNGSIYIPETNQITLQNASDIIYITNRPAWGPSIVLMDSSKALLNAVIVAKSQDNAAYIVAEVSDTNDFTGDVSTRTFPAGMFNISSYRVFCNTDVFTVADETSYYVRVRLVSASGVDVAVSDVIEVTGVAA